MHKCKTEDCERQIEDNIVYCSIECYLYDGGLMREPIQINEIKETKCQLLNPNNAVIGIISGELELNDVRLQIARKKLKGYSINWLDQKIPINEYGVINEWPRGFFDISEKQLMELIKIGYKTEGETK
jgi:hypothetical protein